MWHGVGSPISEQDISSYLERCKECVHLEGCPILRVFQERNPPSRRIADTQRFFRPHGVCFFFAPVLSSGANNLMT
jgi:hypothetical protein